MKKNYCLKLLLVFALIVLTMGCSGQNEAENLRCTTIIVGKSASSDGSVFLAHNEDMSGKASHLLANFPAEVHSPGSKIKLWSGGEIPQVNKTLAFSATRIANPDIIPGDITSAVNERGVTIVNNLAFSKEGRFKDGLLLWTDFIRLGAERAKTARDAVKLLGKLASKHGAALDSGLMFGIADSNEGWWLELSSRGQWVAQRIQNGEAEIRGNCFRIGEVNFKDKDNFLFSSDLVSYAREKKWYQSGKFNFAEVYGTPKSLLSHTNLNRHSRFGELKEEKFSVEDLQLILKDHLGVEDYQPHYSREHTICGLETEISLIFQLRSWVPDGLRSLRWTAFATPCSSVYIPWYANAELSLRYTEDQETGVNRSAYWTFRELSHLVEQDYQVNIEPVARTMGKFQQRINSLQEPVEEKANSAGESECALILSKHANKFAKRAIRKAERLTNRIR